MKDAILRIFLIFSVLFSSAQYKEWEDLSTFKINTEEPHSFFIPKDVNGDSITKYLNGTWNFKLFKNDELVPKDFFKIDFGKDDWQKIPVPSNWSGLLSGPSACKESDIIPSSELLLPV